MDHVYALMYQFFFMYGCIDLLCVDVSNYIY